MIALHLILIDTGSQWAKVWTSSNLGWTLYNAISCATSEEILSNLKQSVH